MQISRHAVATRILSAGLLTLLLPSVTFAQNIAPFSQSFTDVSPRHTYYQAIEDLKKKGILAGYSDGTFRPDQKVTRAEAIKIIIAPLVEASVLASVTSTTFTDIPVGTWYLPYADIARQNKIVDGPPTSPQFHGGRTVLLVEFLKMLFLANRLDPLTLGSDMVLPLSSDVLNSKEWYYPHIRLALASSIISVDSSGKLMPARQLTRGDTAGLLYAFLLSQEGKRLEAQLALAEADMNNVETMLRGQNLPEAEYAAARALLVARGAVASDEKSPLAQGSVQIAKSYGMLTVAVRAGVEKRYQDSLTSAGEAWRIAEALTQILPSLERAKLRIQALAKSVADQSRALLTPQ